MNNNVSSALKSIVTHVYQEVDYYRQLFDEHALDGNKTPRMQDFEQIPFLTIEELQNNESRLLANKYHFFPWTNKLELRRNSSFSGYLTKIYWDYNDNDNSNRLLANIRNKWYKTSESSKVCSFFGTFYIGNKLLPYAKNNLCNGEDNLLLHWENLTDDKMKDYLTKMDTLGVEWLRLRPSVALLLAEAIMKHSMPIPKSLRYLELFGELLHDEHRQFIQETFQVELSYLYGSGEFNSVAFECKHNRLHVLDDNVVVEIIKDGKSVTNKAGEICITSLTNYAMPLLRFMTGDCGVLTESQCPCGVKAPILQLIESRPCSFIVTESGQKISNCVLETIIERTNEFMHHAVRQFRIIQKGPNDISVGFSLKPAYISWQESIRQEFLANIKEPGLLQANWNFMFTS